MASPAKLDSGITLDANSVATATERRKRNAQRREALLRFFSVASFFLVWEAFSHLNASVLHLFNPILAPAPEAVVAAGIEMLRTGELVNDIVASMSRVIRGFCLAAIVGVAAGVIVGRSRILSSIVEPIIDMLRPIPSLAFLPMLVLWLGIGEMSKIVFIAYATFFPIFTTTIQGVRHIDPILLRAAASLGTSRRDMFRYVELPAALPSIITGLRIGFGQAFFVIVAAEFIAADAGLGFLINDSRTFFEVPRMLLGAMVIGLIGFSFNTILRRVEARLLRWHTSAQG